MGGSVGGLHGVVGGSLRFVGGRGGRGAGGGFVGARGGVGVRRWSGGGSLVWRADCSPSFIEVETSSEPSRFPTCSSTHPARLSIVYGGEGR